MSIDLDEPASFSKLDIKLSFEKINKNKNIINEWHGYSHVLTIQFKNKKGIGPLSMRTV